MPQVEPVRVKQRRPLILAVAAGLVLLAVGGYITWRLVPSATSTVKQTDALNAQGNYTEAQKKLQSAYKRAIFQDDKTLILSRLAATSSNKGDLQLALGYYQRLEQLQPDNYAAFVSGAQLAERLNDKAAAISQYQKALALVKGRSTGELTEAETESLNAHLAELQQ